MELTEPGELLFGATSIWKACDAAFLNDIELVPSLLSIALEEEGAPSTVLSPSQAWGALRSLTLQAFGFDSSVFAESCATLCRQIVTSIIQKLEYTGSTKERSTEAAYRERVERNGESMLAILAISIPENAPSSANVGALDAVQLRHTIEALIALIWSGVKVPTAGRVLALLAKVLTIAGPSVSDAGIDRFLVGQQRFGSAPGVHSIGFLCALVDGGEGALKMLDASRHGRIMLSEASSGDLNHLVECLGDLESEFDSTGYRMAVTGLLQIVETALPDFGRDIVPPDIVTNITKIGKVAQFMQTAQVSLLDNGRIEMASANFELLTEAHRLLIDAHADCFSKVALVELSGVALTALLELKSVPGFMSAITTFINRSLGNWEKTLPRVGSCTDDANESLEDHVRQANVALSLLGGYAEVIRPGAAARSSNGGERVQILDISRTQGLATVSHLPPTSEVHAMNIDDLMPLTQYSIAKDKAHMPLLIPYLNWHLSSMAGAPAGTLNGGAFIRLRSNSNEDDEAAEDADAGGGWNRPRQACLTLRALHSMLVQHPDEGAKMIAADQQLVSKLLRMAVSLGDEIIPSEMPVGETIHQLEVCVSVLIDMLLHTEHGLDQDDASSEADDSVAVDAGLTTDEISVLRISSVNFAMPYEEVVSLYLAFEKDYEKMMMLIAEQQFSETPGGGGGAAAPAAAEAPAKPDGAAAAVVSPAMSEADCAAIQWILTEGKAVDNESVFAARFQQWARTMHALGEKGLADGNADEGRSCFKKAWALYTEASPADAPDFPDLDTLSIDELKTALHNRRDYLADRWQPALLNEGPVEPCRFDSDDMPSLESEAEASRAAGTAVLDYAHAVLHPLVQTLPASDAVSVAHDGKDVQLLQACSSGLMVEAMQLIKDGANPQVRDAAGRTPFFRACSAGHLDLVKAMSWTGSKSEKLAVNSQLCVLHIGKQTPDLQGTTPYLAACANGHIDVVKFLLEMREKYSLECNADDDSGGAPPPQPAKNAAALHNVPSVKDGTADGDDEEKRALVYGKSSSGVSHARSVQLLSSVGEHPACGTYVIEELSASSAGGDLVYNRVDEAAADDSDGSLDGGRWNLDPKFIRKVTITRESTWEKLGMNIRSVENLGGSDIEVGAFVSQVTDGGAAARLGNDGFRQGDYFLSIHNTNVAVGASVSQVTDGVARVGNDDFRQGDYFLSIHNTNVAAKGTTYDAVLAQLAKAELIIECLVINASDLDAARLPARSGVGKVVVSPAEPERGALQTISSKQKLDGGHCNSYYVSCAHQLASLIYTFTRSAPPCLFALPCSFRLQFILLL